MHGYYQKKVEQDPGIDRSLSFPGRKIVMQHLSALTA